MTLIRWNPAYRTRTVDTFQNEIDRLFQGALAPSDVRSGGSLAPAVDIEETKEAFVFRADLPGVKAEDVKLSLEGDVLTLRGERRAVHTAGEGSTQRVERAFGPFERQFSFDTPVKPDAISATYRDGVLEVTVPKADVAKAREIQIQAG